ncbi:MAG: 4-hydroxy-3-methylbut-2-enyl diphosphate reductase [Pseudomonadota bacterium]
MKIIIAKTAGFCMGVRRAVEMALDSPGKHRGPIFTHGPLIHNPQVLDLLAEKGVHIIQNIPETGEGTVLIRAHGVPPVVKKDLKKAGFAVIDATCPRVIKVQAIIKKHARQGYASIIIGDRDHPEVVGLMGYAAGNGYIAGSIEELESLPEFDKAILVAQTTLNTRLFEAVNNWARACHPHYKCFHTICDSTAQRQAEVQEMAAMVDALIVVGGKNSGNTQRLAEIAGQSGIATFHIETECDLDVKALSLAETIGITAGASTPNWIINRVVRAVERLPYKNSAGIQRFVFSIQQALLLTNVFVAAGAGCLSYACAVMMGIGDFLPHVWISMLYVLSMHTLNNLTGLKADRYNDPERETFYRGHKRFLICLALFSGAAGLLIAYSQGITTFLVLLMMSILGLSYNITLIPKTIIGKYSRIRDISGSKTILIAVAWGVVTSVLPAISAGNPIDMKTTLVFFWATGLAFARTAFFDILDMQGDRIVGKETIPILLGEKKSIRILKAVLGIWVVLFIYSSLTGIIPALGIGLSVCPATMLALISMHENGFMLPGIRLEFLVESHFFLAGMVTLLYTAFLHT